jgi:hypothetical protein
VAVDHHNAATALIKLSQGQREHPQCAAVVLLDQPNSHWESGFREAGAQLIVTSLFELPLLARIARRQFARTEQPELDWRAAIKSRMPWSRQESNPRH